MKNFLEDFGIDTYELGARYTPAFIFEILFLYSFSSHLKFLNLKTLEQVNKLIPLSIYAPIIILIFSFPIKAILRLLGEIIENIIWSLKQPTIVYISRGKNLENISINLEECPKRSSLKQLIDDKDCHRFLIEFLKAKTRNNNKLKYKLIEYGFFKNMFAGFLLLSLLDIIFLKIYYLFYAFCSVLFFVATLIYSYYSYPKQLINSFLEEKLR